MLPLTVAFLGGIASFLSPCVLPLLPSYLTVLAAGGTVGRGRRLLNALGFVLGFGSIFVLLGLSATIAGQFMLQHKVLLRWVGGIFVIGFGLFMTGVLQPRLLLRDYRIHYVPKQIGFGNAILLGIAFGFGWTACVTPWLTTILVLASQTAHWQAGAILLVIYAMGLGMPFLALGIFADRMMRRLKAMSRYSALIERTGGVLLILLGVLMITGVLERLSGLGSFI